MEEISEMEGEADSSDLKLDDLPDCRVKRNYTCSECGYHTISPRSYLYHLRDEHGYRHKVFECPQCLYASKHQQKLNRHIKNVHVEGEKKRKAKMIAPQKISSPVVVDMDAIKIMKSSITFNEKPIQVSSLSTVTEETSCSPNGEIKFSPIASEEEDEGSTSKSFDIPEDVAPPQEDDECNDFEMEEYEKLVADGEEEENEEENEEEEDEVDEQPVEGGEFKCSACDFATKSAISLERHEKKVHLKKKFYRCTRCNYVTNVRSRFTKHVKYHSMPFTKCDVCDFKTPYKWNLDRHMKNHTDPVGPYSCTICTFATETKQSLTVHVQNHHKSIQGTLNIPKKKRNRSKVKPGIIPPIEIQEVAASTNGSIAGGDSDLDESIGDMEVAEEDIPEPVKEQESVSKNNGIPELANEEDTSNKKENSNTAKSEKKDSKVSEKPPSKSSKKSPKSRGSHSSNMKKDFMDPENIIYKHGKAYVRQFKCKYCNYEAAWEGYLMRHCQKYHAIEWARDEEERRLEEEKRRKEEEKRKAEERKRKEEEMKRLQEERAKRLEEEKKRREAEAQKRREEAARIKKMREEKRKKEIEEMKRQREMMRKFPYNFVVASDLNFLPTQYLPPQVPASHPPILTVKQDLPPEEDMMELIEEKDVSKPLVMVDSKMPPKHPQPIQSLLALTTSQIPSAHHQDMSLKRLLFENKQKDVSKPADDKNDMTLADLLTTDLPKKAPAPEAKKYLEEEDSGWKDLDGMELKCELCGHEAKDAVAAVQHRRLHLSSNSARPTPAPMATVRTGRGTRCQYCRRRCKTEMDLLAHEETCDVKLKQEESSVQPEPSKEEKTNAETTYIKPDETTKKEENSAQNRVFVWNHIPPPEEAKSLPAQKPVEVKEEDNRLTKKYYKCPQCKFWATTASRFHIHFMGHLNCRPFECSACGYRSNWRWDTTKHIRVKGEKDENHKNALVVLRDDYVGDFEKYEQYTTTVIVDKKGLEGRKSDEEYTPSPPPPQAGGVKGLLDSIPLLRASVEGDKLAPILPKTSDKPGGSQLPRLPRLIRAPTVPVPSATPSSMPSGRGLSFIRGNYVPINTSGGSTLLLTGQQPSYPQGSNQVFAAQQNVYIDAFGRDATFIPSGQSVLQISPSSIPVTQTIQRPPPLLVKSTQANSLSSVSHSTAQEGLKTQKTMWKCKKCEFRHESRSVMLEHVAAHYGGKPSTTGSLLGAALTAPSYCCGFCGILSGNRENIERHCRLQHNGQVSVVVNSSMRQEHQDIEEVTQEVTTNEQHLLCGVCPFKCNSSNDLSLHSILHTPRPNAVHKCPHCPYWVAESLALQNHIMLHERPNVDSSKKSESVEEKDSSQDPHIKQRSPEIDTSHKRHTCTECPYRTAFRAQLLYHKQFHRPRGAPFRCPHCSYNVSKGHLLAQHIRLHSQEAEQAESTIKWFSSNKILGLNPNVETSREGERFSANENGENGEYSNMKEYVFREELMNEDRGTKRSFGESMQEHEEEEISIDPTDIDTNGLNLDDTVEPKPDSIDTVNLKEIPLVWVAKDGKYLKMYKCRYCPHVNMRKANVVEHEKMHSEKVGNLHQCPLCNYTCNNRGVMAVHMNVHKNKLGEVRALVDKSKTDEEQLRDIENDAVPDDAPVLFFCQNCPARFLQEREINIHKKFHMMRLPHACNNCSYTARQDLHLMAHAKVHSLDYEQRTLALLKTHRASETYPPNKQTNINYTKPIVSTPKKTPKMHSCPECPAKFFKYATFMHHRSLHGCDDKYKCDQCNYGVKTIGNLARHKMIHDDFDREGRTDTGLADMEELGELQMLPVDDIPMSGVELLQRKLAMERECNSGTPVKNVGNMELLDPTLQPLSQFLEKDPAKKGNPDFFYPTYLKNGKVKTKRYKCPKCPTAVEKREQYEVHLKLHGSKSKHTCDRCDYSVKYYCNFLQHKAKHLRHEIQMKEMYGIDIVPKKKEEPEDITDSSSKAIEDEPFLPRPPSGDGAERLTLVEKQQIMLAELHALRGGGRKMDKKTLSCYLCPYTCVRRDHLENHHSRHAVNGGTGSFACPLCDYRGSQSNFLKEHIRYHFRHSKFCQPECFMKFDKVEIWSHGADEKMSPETDTMHKQVTVDENSPSPPPVQHESLISLVAKEIEPSECINEANALAVVNLISGDIVGGKVGEILPLKVTKESDETKSPGRYSPKKKYKTKDDWRRKCPYCPVTIDRKSRLKNHIALHGSDHPYKCGKCDYAVPHFANLKKHQRVHMQHESGFEVGDDMEKLEGSLSRRGSEDSTLEDDETSLSEGLASGSCTSSSKATPTHVLDVEDSNLPQAREDIEDASLLLASSKTEINEAMEVCSEGEETVECEQVQESVECMQLQEESLETDGVVCGEDIREAAEYEANIHEAAEYEENIHEEYEAMTKNEEQQLEESLEMDPEDLLEQEELEESMTAE